MSQKQTSDFERISNKKNYIEQNKNKIPTKSLEQFERQFALDFTYETTSLEGNSLTREQVNRILSLKQEEREQFLKNLEDELKSMESEIERLNK